MNKRQKKKHLKNFLKKYIVIQDRRTDECEVVEKDKWLKLLEIAGISYDEWSKR